MAKDVIITSAVIGAEVTKENYPHFPDTPEKLAQSAYEAVQAGASIIHLHVRDKDGSPSQDVAIFKDVTERIKAKCDCIVQYSTGGAAGTPVDLRCAPLKLKPEMATLSMGTLNFGDTIFENSQGTITQIAEGIKKNGVMPELEIFDLGMMEALPRYIKWGIVPEKYHVDFVLGVFGGMSGTVKNLELLVNMLPPKQNWTVAGIGKAQLPLTAHALAMGGHIRVGLEDNVYYRKGEFATSNAQLVERVARMAKEMERPVASVERARKILGL